MAKKQNNGEDLKISEFIKQPASLKLLILAGTNIPQNQILTISKCTGLIKLDLSSNFLSNIPIKFNNFPHMKILYLHDNRLSKIQIENTHLEYVSLFSNHIQPSQYRKDIIKNNPYMLGIDHNIISQREKAHQQMSNNVDLLPVYSQLKWPIVQISTHLQQQDDYLNLLKAQVFVINNVYKRTTKIQLIQRSFHVLAQLRNFRRLKIQASQQYNYMKPSVLKAARKWMEYTKLKRKLRVILKSKGKQDLLLSKLQRNRKQRGQGVNQIMEAFLPLVRKKMAARASFQRNIRSFRAFIPAQKRLEKQYLGFDPQKNILESPVKLYFRQSEYDILSKVMLFTKKLLFKEKQYDLCDQFNNLFRETSKKYILYRKSDYLSEERSWIMNSIHETTGYVMREMGIDRRNLLYNRTGHKSLKIKSCNKKLPRQSYYERMMSCDRKMDYIENKYDKLIQYEVKNYKILRYITRIARYINAGNSSTIISTEVAYFQTQVNFQSKQEESKARIKLHLGLQFFIKRVNAANIIQRFFRKKLSQKKYMNTLQILRFNRANNLISKWMQNRIFEHRVVAVKNHSYYESIWKQSQVYLHLDIYMKIPIPTNFLRYNKQDPKIKIFQNKNQFYDLFHKNTQVQIVQIMGRKWLKICYPSVKQAIKAQKTLYANTYRYYYNGFSIKLFSGWDVKDLNFIKQYQQRVKHLFDINIQKSGSEEKLVKLLWIDNLSPFFIWSQMESDQTKRIFGSHQKKSTNVSIFLYNKHKRPLKVSCQFYWVQLQSIYFNRKIIHRNIQQPTSNKSIMVMQEQTPKGRKKQRSFNLKQGSRQKWLEQKVGIGYLVDIPLRKSRRSSLGSSKASSLMKSHRTRLVGDPKLDLLSQTLNIRRK